MEITTMANTGRFGMALTELAETSRLRHLDVRQGRGQGQASTGEVCLSQGSGLPQITRTAPMTGVQGRSLPRATATAVAKPTYGFANADITSDQGFRSAPPG